jgi:hypothetical protein
MPVKECTHAGAWVYKVVLSDWKIDIYHYLHTLKRKPGALHQSTALLQSDTRIKKLFETYYSSDARTFLEVLEIIYENPK